MAAKKAQATDATPKKDSGINQSSKKKLESKSEKKTESSTGEKASHKKKRKTKSVVNNETDRTGSPSKKSRKK